MWSDFQDKYGEDSGVNASTKQLQTEIFIEM